jgi:hypothetical protein
MAQNDVVFFDAWMLQLAEKQHDHENDDFQFGLTDGTTTPADATADPHWGGTGTTNFATEQVAIGGNYTGPVSLANPSAALNGSTLEIDWDDPATWVKHASNPTDAAWGIVFNNTLVAKKCVGWVDIGGTFNMTTGDLSIAFGTPAATLTKP